MSVTVTGNDIHDVRRKVGLNLRNAPISISWRLTSDDHFERTHLAGAIVDATPMKYGLVPLEFKTCESALDYIAVILREHEARAVEVQTEEAKVHVKETQEQSLLAMRKARGIAEESENA